MVAFKLLMLATNGHLRLMKLFPEVFNLVMPEALSCGPGSVVVQLCVSVADDTRCMSCCNHCICLVLDNQYS